MHMTRIKNNKHMQKFYINLIISPFNLSKKFAFKFNKV